MVHVLLMCCCCDCFFVDVDDCDVDVVGSVLCDVCSMIVVWFMIVVCDVDVSVCVV